MKKEKKKENTWEGKVGLFILALTSCFDIEESDLTLGSIPTDC